MSTVEESIDVQVPVRTAYNQWTQFAEFPKFMEGVEEIRQLDDTRLHWKTKIAGVTREFDAQITEQTPDQRIAWNATDGTQHAGVVTFHRLDDTTTRIMVQMDTEPEGVVEQMGDKLGVLGSETGAWRGEVEQGATGGRFARSTGSGSESTTATPAGTTTGTSGSGSGMSGSGSGTSL
jgi:hypothetical protein